MTVKVPPTRAELLQSQLGALGDLWLGLTCDACNKLVYAPMKLLARRHGSDVTLGQVLGRMSCGTCRSPPGNAWVVDEHGHRPETWRVAVLP